MSELRDYQLRAIDMVRARANDRPLLVVGTGAGKTTIAAEIIRRTTERGKRSIFLVHRRELVDQAVDRLAQFGIHAGRILAGHPERRDRLVQVASIPTLLRREHWPADVCFVDEAAHAVSASWSEVIKRYDGSLVIGLTATPIRLDGRGLGDLFGCIVEPVTTRELIDRGYLVEPRVFAPPVDLSGIKIRAGDYDLPQLAERMNKLTGSITREWQRWASGQSTVAFAVNCDHSRAIVSAFEALGVRAAHVDYSMSHKPRAQILRDLREGRLDLVSQVQLLSEGWDLPTLQCAILARPTKSLALFRQMVGRVMRPPGPVVVIDHAGNHHEHGLVTEPIEWSLDSVRRRSASDAPAVRTCRECFCVIPPTADVCPECGAPCVRVSTAIPPAVENPGQLVELNLAARPPLPPRSEREAAYRRMVQSASFKGRKLGSARAIYKERFGEWPRFGNVEMSEYKCVTHEWEQRQWGVRCKRCLRSPAATAVTR